ncbi:MAG: hypothetical protein LBU61_04955 [Coriobacteriales bacterium]|jgi:hypothetical protein|nr:hypothetical protein [Coriobacteriales bacterium]
MTTTKGFIQPTSVLNNGEKTRQKPCSHTHSHGRWIISTQLSIILVISLFGSLPQTAHANNLSVEIFDSDSNIMIQTKIQTAINGSASGDTVTVTGSNYKATEPLVLQIKDGVKVLWKAYYDKSSYIDLYEWAVILSGSGVFEIAQYAYIYNFASAHGLLSTGTTTIVICGTISASRGWAVQAVSPGSSVEVRGGRVHTLGDVPAIESRNIYVYEGSYIENLWTGDAIKAIGKDSQIVVKDSTVFATTGFAILSDLTGTVIIDNSFVIAYGREPLGYDGQKNVVMMQSGTPQIINNAIVCAWDYPPDGRVYREGSSEDLVANAGATVNWHLAYHFKMILYKMGTHEGYFDLPDIYEFIQIDASAVPLTSTSPPEVDTSSPDEVEASVSGEADMTSPIDGLATKPSPTDGVEDLPKIDNSSGDKAAGDTASVNLKPWQLVLFGGLIMAAGIGGSAGFVMFRKRFATSIAGSKNTK